MEEVLDNEMKTWLFRGLYVYSRVSENKGYSFGRPQSYIYIGVHDGDPHLWKLPHGECRNKSTAGATLNPIILNPEP